VLPVVRVGRPGPGSAFVADFDAQPVGVDLGADGEVTAVS